MKIAFFSLKKLAILLLAIGVLSFTNHEQEQVSFSITASVSGNVNTGNFASTGFELSAGDFSEAYSFNGKKVHSEVTFTYSDGTITAKTHSDVNLTGETTATGTGTWIITKGTGAYEHIKGSGQLTFAVVNINTSLESISQEWVGTLK